MDLSPKLLHDVEFREKWRGYDPDEVDAFLEQVAQGLDGLLTRLRDAERRAELAERRSQEVGEADEALRRTLVLAQRTADAAVAEAEERARTLVGEAEETAARLVGEAEARSADVHAEIDAQVREKLSEAEERARALVAQTEQDVHRQAEEARQRLEAEIDALSDTRRSLRAEADALERHVAGQRERVAAAVVELQRILDDPEALQGTGRPPSTPEPVPVPDVAPAPPHAEAASARAAMAGAQGGGEAEERSLPPLPWDQPGDAVAPPEASEEPAPDPLAAPVEVSAPAMSWPPPPMPAEAVNGGTAARAVPAPELPPSSPPQANSRPVLTVVPTPPDPAAAATEALLAGPPGDGAPRPAAPAGAGASPAAEGPATQEVPMLHVDAAASEDPYLAELRRALVDPEPLGPRDDELPLSDDDDLAFFDQDRLDQQRWSGSRRRRR